MAQDTICVYGQQGHQLFDIRNIKEIGVQHDTLTANFGTLSLEVPFDSISFSNAPTGSTRVGWWGDIDEGMSACYYWPDSTNVPNVQLLSDSGQCVSVMAFMNDRIARRQQPRRVGTKWRYTMGTLTGRRRVHMSCFGPTCFEHYTWNGECSYEGCEAVDMSNMFAGQTSRTVCHVLDYWHRPTAVRTMPERPVLGRFDGYHYEQSLVDDSLHIVVDLSSDADGKVVSDTMKLVFCDDYIAQLAFADMTVTGDDGYSIALFGNTIIIVEYFEATLDEVQRWLVRFDLDLYKPLFLRNDE
ncbi:MAG: hypothetical protein IJV36_08230 [Prevotella sp.]|nr:hypothetical protein [Prevotella sp.]